MKLGAGLISKLRTAGIKARRPKLALMDCGGVQKATIFSFGFNQSFGTFCLRLI
jgi:hypothetical protein